MRKGPGERRRNILTLRLTDAEMRELREISKSTGRSMTDVIRTYMDFSKVLFSELTLTDALAINERTIPLIKFITEHDLDLPLHEAIRPFGELAKILEAKRVLAVEAEMRKERLKKSWGQ